MFEERKDCFYMNFVDDTKWFNHDVIDQIRENFEWIGWEINRPKQWQKNAKDKEKCNYNWICI